MQGLKLLLKVQNPAYEDYIKDIKKTWKWEIAYNLLKLCSLQEFLKSVFLYCDVTAKQLQQILQSLKGWPIECCLSNQNDIMHCPFLRKNQSCSIFL